MAATFEFSDFNLFLSIKRIGKLCNAQSALCSLANDELSNMFFITLSTSVNKAVVTITKQEIHNHPIF